MPETVWTPAANTPPQVSNCLSAAPCVLRCRRTEGRSTCPHDSTTLLRLYVPRQRACLRFLLIVGLPLRVRMNYACPKEAPVTTAVSNNRPVHLYIAQNSMFFHYTQKAGEASASPALCDNYCYLCLLCMNPACLCHPWRQCLFMAKCLGHTRCAVHARCERYARWRITIPLRCLSCFPK